MRLLRLLKRDLVREISDWVDEGLISTDQARSICQKYAVDFDTINNHSMAYGVLVALAYLFFGLALITLIGANWEDIPRFTRMLGLLILTMGTHAMALKLYLNQQEAQATAAFFLGNLFYGASIILIAQIYHLGEHMADGILWWALGTLPFALLLKNRWLMLFSLLLAWIWFFLEVDAGFFPTLFPLFLAAAGYVLSVEEKSSPLLFLTAVAGIIIWFEILLSFLWSQPSYHFDISEEHFFISIALFIFLSSVSCLLHRQSSAMAKEYGTILSLWALRFSLLTLLIMSFEQPWKELLRTGWHHQASMWSIILLFIGLAMFISWKVNQLKTLPTIALLCFCTMLIVVISQQWTLAIYFQIISNIALICSGILLLYRGIHHGISHYFFLGISTILLTGFLRYIDLIGDYIGASILFMLLAIVMLSSARFWKNHSQQRASA